MSEADRVATAVPRRPPSHRVGGRATNGLDPLLPEGKVRQYFFMTIL